MVGLPQLVGIGAVLATLVDARAIKRDVAVLDAPTGYAPSRVDCPADTQVITRQRDSPMNQAEQSYVMKKANSAGQQWRDYLVGANLTGFDVDALVSVPGSGKPRVAIAASGGGVRAALFAAGVLNAFDARNADAVKAGTGGLLQLAHYLSSVSGGAWMAGSWALDGYPEFPSLVESWNLDEPIWEPKDVQSVAVDVVTNLKNKLAAGFNVSTSDVVGRFLARHFINDTQAYGANTTFSSIRKTAGYVNGSFPFPIMTGKVYTGEPPNGYPVSAPLIEITPEEFGTWDKGANATGTFFPTELLGTSTQDRRPVGRCVKGFDNAGYMLATTSNLLAHPKARAMAERLINHPIFRGFFTGSPPAIVSSIIPNPFFDQQAKDTPWSSKDLFVADGGIANEIVPVWPLLQHMRHVDVIIALDATDDGDGYSQGSALKTAYEKSLRPEYKYLNPMPPIPSLPLPTHPAFFGCDSPDPSPILISLPNRPFTNASAPTNLSTFADSADGAARRVILDNAFAVATQSNTTLGGGGAGGEGGGDREWPACLACAVVDKSVRRIGKERTEQCQACFKRYCA